MRVLSALALFAVMAFFTSCEQEMLEPTANETETETGLGGGGSDNFLESVLSIDYDKDNDNYYVVGVKDGQIDVYYGENKSWTKLQENRDIDNRYSPSQFVDFALGAEPGEAMFGVAVGNKDGQGTSINAREFSSKPYFGDGRPEAIGTLTSVLSIDYDADNNQYVVVGKGPDGKIDVYYGEHKSWTKLQENRDIDNRYSASQFVDFSLGGAGSKFGVAIGNVSNYKVGWRQYEPRATSINCREFYSKPWFGDGKPKAIGTLVEAYAVEYDADNDNYYVVGKGPNGDIDVWYGTHGSWTQLQENRDIDNRYSPSEFVDFSLGTEPGEAMFGVVVGNKENFTIAFRETAPRGTSINAREFSNKPYFGDGKPEVIKE